MCKLSNINKFLVGLSYSRLWRPGDYQAQVETLIQREVGNCAGNGILQLFGNIYLNEINNMLELAKRQLQKTLHENQVRRIGG